MARLLVTGGAGYIGSHTCQVLARAGHEPITYDSMERGNPDYVKWGPLEIGNIRDNDRLKGVLEKYRPDAVLHFAAYIDAAESVADPGKYYRNNVAGTLALLGTMQQCDIRNLVFSSSAAVYGNPEYLPIPEEHPINPINPYGHSKRMAEQVIADFGHAYDMGWAALRYFNAAGADPDGQLGPHRGTATNLIPLVLRAALGDGPPITIFGTDFKTTDGTAIRDFIHVCDLATAHAAAVEHLLSGGQSVTVNLGTGRGHSVREVIGAAERALKRPVPVQEGAPRPGDPVESVANAQRAAEILGWHAQRAPIDEIVGSEADWALQAAS